LLIRYGTSPEGKPVKKAEVYTAGDHHIDPALIDVDAHKIIRRLRREGYKAFIVGGAVRDLLTGLQPKDFDIATDAFPRRIRKIFRNSRIIGRRFRLVHIYAQRDGKRKILEVSTFRSSQSEEPRRGGKRKQKSNNVYGRMEEDVWRRDFTLNALYYCPERRIIIDFVGGYRDIQEGKICTLTPTDTSFGEDPVRMIRGIKYAELTGFPLSMAVTAAIKRHRDKLTECSAARLTEEVYKILGSGYAAGIFLRAYRLRLLEVFMPALHVHWRSLGRRQMVESLRTGLGVLDQRLKNDPTDPVSRGSMLAFVMKSFSRRWRMDTVQEELIGSVVDWIQETCRPLLPSRKESERAARLLLRWQERKAL
jgi:poly(A) polymerase